MRNHRRYEVKKGRMMPRYQRFAANSSGNTSQLPNMDADEDEENHEDENNGGETNGLDGSDAEDD